MKKLVVVLMTGALVASVSAMSKAPAGAESCSKDKACVKEAACCTVDGSCKTEATACKVTTEAGKAACGAEKAVKEAGCTGSVCPLSK